MRRILLTTLTIFLFGCGPVSVPMSNEYQLVRYNNQKLTNRTRPITLLVTLPEALAGFQTPAMRFIEKPFQLESFTKNSWTSAPADMLFSLLVQSIQSTGYFYAVSSSPYTEGTNYRLDTQLFYLQQNFLYTPSHLELAVKFTLVRLRDNKTQASIIVQESVPCTRDSPYGGVIAANEATFRITTAVVQFLKQALKLDK